MTILGHKTISAAFLSALFLVPASAAELMVFGLPLNGKLPQIRPCSNAEKTMESGRLKSRCLHSKHKSSVGASSYMSLELPRSEVPTWMDVNEMTVTVDNMSGVLDQISVRVYGLESENSMQAAVNSISSRFGLVSKNSGNPDETHFTGFWTAPDGIRVTISGGRTNVLVLFETQQHRDRFRAFIDNEDRKRASRPKSP